MSRLNTKICHLFLATLITWDCPLTALQNAAAQYPPSIRAMVTASDTLDAGSLHLITYTGITVGREKNLGHGIIIPDEQVSKVNASSLLVSRVSLWSHESMMCACVCACVCVCVKAMSSCTVLMHVLISAKYHLTHQNRRRASISPASCFCL